MPVDPFPPQWHLLAEFILAESRGLIPF